MWAELQRRHVVRVVVAYVVAATAVGAAADVFLPGLGAPEWVLRTVLGLLVLALPLAAALAWAYDVTPGGIERTSPAGSSPEEADLATASASEADGAEAVPSPLRLAVLPFGNIQSAREDDYFADGMTEELTSVISRVSGLEVIARTSVMPYKAAPQPVSVVARELMVGTVLEGSIRRSGDRVRVTVQLISTATEAHLWSQDYDRELSDIFAIQTEIALSVAEALRVRLLGDEEERIERAPTENLEAHDLYLLGRHQLLKRNHEGLLRAIELFEEALTKDPSYALASAGLGQAWMWASIGYVADAPPDAAARARAAAERAVQLDDRVAETHVGLAVVANLQGDADAAWPSIQRAIELNPSSAEAFQALAYYWIVKGDFTKQLEAIERAMVLDPRSPSIRLEAGWPHGYERRYELFLERAREALELDPDYALAHFNLGNSLDALGDSRAALSAYERAIELGGVWGQVKGFTVRSLMKLGREDEARAVLAEMLDNVERDTSLSVPLAIAYDALGESEEALDWLEQGYEMGMAQSGWLHLEGFVPFEATRDHPRFQALLEKDARRSGRS